ncbi:TonB-dependent receptor [Paucibacter sp. APW11]|uniref:TonB-dependent receptor n=1 Tax=Roseateles aquae TaxID=3077235 RepID=A0ABU3P9Y2_9BURK|nr:TonB-dependent receptor [Paucibacter sp. APW11]MDT8999362.1 TonB-dependent receptor [Paucibacter sp. APW11]
MRRLPERLLVVLLALLAVTPAPAAEALDEDLQLEELLKQGLSQTPRGVQVSTASRFAQSAEQAPALTYVMTDEDIRRFGMRSITDVLRSLPGIYITTNRNFSYIGARGLGRPGDYNSRLLLLIDGVRTNDAATDAALVGPEFFLPVDLIERVEFTPGPGSALYGNNAFLGVINIITKRADKLAGVQARLSADSMRGSEAQLSIGQRFEQGGEAWLSASLMDRARLEYGRPVPAEFDGLLRSFNWDRAKRLVVSASVGGWSLRAGIAERQRGLPSPLAYEPLQLGQFVSVYRNAFGSLGYETSLGPEWDLSVDGSLQRSISYGRHPFFADDGSLSTYMDQARARWAHFDLRLGNSHFANHYLLFGIERQLDFDESISGSVNGEVIQAFGGRVGRSGLYIQDEWKISANALLVAGLRRDLDDRAIERSVNPRLALVWRIGADANLRASYGSAFRAANLNEFATNYSLEGETPRPERVRSFELSWEHRANAQLQYRASYFHSHLIDLISAGNDTPLYQNDGPIHSQGVDLGLEQRWKGGARLAAALSVQRTRDSAHKALNNSPAKLLKLHLSYPLWEDKLYLGWQLLAQSRRLTVEHSLPGCTIHNVHLSWQFDRWTELGLGLHNASDTLCADHTDLASPPMAQEWRQLRLSLSRRFGS